MMNHRSNSVLVNDTGINAALAVSYTVTCYARGAVANETDASATDINVRQGHGFRVGDVFMVGTDTTKVATITSKTATNLVWSGAISITSGDLLVNLGTDGLTGGTPDYDGSPMRIYSVPDGSAVTDLYLWRSVTVDPT